MSLLADLGVQLGEALLYLQQAPLLREGSFPTPSLAAASSAWARSSLSAADAA